MGVWRSVTTMSGAQCVMTFGVLQMPQQCVDNLDCQQKVQSIIFFFEKKIKLQSIPGAVAGFYGFTNGAGQIWLDNVQCHGTETTLTDCPSNALGKHDCAHTEDAGVACQPAIGMLWEEKGTRFSFQVEALS